MADWLGYKFRGSDINCLGVITANTHRSDSRHNILHIRQSSKLCRLECVVETHDDEDRGGGLYYGRLYMEAGYSLRECRRNMEGSRSMESQCRRLV